LIQTRPPRAVAMRWSGVVQVSLANDSDCVPCFLKYDLQVLSPALAFVA
jgi:hypothetical protein